MKLIFALLSVYTCAVLGNPYFPRVTSITIDAVHGFQPTSPPRAELVKRKLEKAALEKRQFTSGELLGSSVDDRTCGYNNGRPGVPVTCGPDAHCVVAELGGGIPGPVGCCPDEGTEDCAYFVECLDGTQASSCQNDHVCQADTETLLCTGSYYSACYGYTFPQLTATFWQCETSSPTAGMDYILTTYDNQLDGKTWTPIYYTPTSTAAITTSVPTPRPTQSPSHSKPVGAIVGGVIGGLAVLGAIACGIIFLCLRKRKAKKNTANEHNGAIHTNPDNPSMAQADSGLPPNQQYPPAIPQEYLQAQHAAKAPDERAASIVSSPGSPAPPYSHPSSPYSQHGWSPQNPHAAPLAPVSYQPGQAPVELGDGFARPVRNDQGGRIHEIQG